MMPIRVVPLRLAFLALAVLFLGSLPGRALAEPLPIDGVEELRVLLHQEPALGDASDLVARRRELREAASRLPSLGEVARALSLSEWGGDFDPLDAPASLEKIAAAVRQPNDDDFKRDLQMLMNMAGGDSASVAKAAAAEIERNLRNRLLDRLEQRLRFYLDGYVEFDLTAFSLDSSTFALEPLEHRFRVSLRAGRSTERIAASNLISETMSSSRASAKAELPGSTADKTIAKRGITLTSRSLRGRLQSLSDDLAKLTRDSDPLVQVAAIRALSNLEKRETVDTLKPLLNAGRNDVLIRRATARAFAHMVEIIAKQADEGRRQPIFASLERIFPAAASGLRDPDVEARRSSLTACLGVVTVLEELLVGNPASAGGDQTNSESKAPMLSPVLYKPVLTAIRDSLPDLNHGARDAVPELRVDACHLLERLAKVWRKVHPPGELPRPRRAEPPKQTATAPGKESAKGGTRSSSGARRPAGRPSQWAAARTEAPLSPTTLMTPVPLRSDMPSAPRTPQPRFSAGPLQPAAFVARHIDEPPAKNNLETDLEGTVEAMIDGLSDPDYRVRLSSVDVLETLRIWAVPAIPALVKALGDTNKFVRWASARTLGRLAEAATKNNQAKDVVAGLMRLLNDREDVQVRKTAALAIQQYGPAAKDAVPQLARGINRGDKEYIIAVLRALQAIGTEAQPALPNVAWIMNRRDLATSVRVEAAQTLGRFGALARKQLPDLRAIMESDPNDEVRDAASSAVLAIERPE